MFSLCCRVKIGFAVLLVCGIGAIGQLVGSSVEINLIATADLHGRTEQIRYAIDPLVRQMRKSDPDTVYIDAGDTIQGSYALLKSRGSNIMKLLGSTGCDIWVPGNHELEYGMTAFVSAVREFPKAALACNARIAGLENKLQDYIILERKGVKIAFIGMVLKDMELGFPIPAGSFKNLPGAAALRSAVNRAKRDGAQIFVLVRHCGVYGSHESLADLLHNVPEIDLVIGAHTHQTDPGRRIRKAFYVQPGERGRYAVICQLVYDKKLRRLQNIRSRIKALDIFPQEDAPETFEVIDSFAGKDPRFIPEKIRRFANSDLALYAVSDRAGLRKLLSDPAATLGDAYNVFGYFDGIVAVSVTPREAETILKEYSKFARRRKQWLLTDGFALKRGKAVFENSKEKYLLAMTAYAAAGAGGNLPESRRILLDRLDPAAAEKSPALLEILIDKCNSKR